MADAEILAKKAAKVAYDREYRAKNREKIAAAKKAWGQGDVKKTYDKKWAEENRERSREIKAAWKARNPNADKEYRENNAEQFTAQRRKAYLANREDRLAYTAAWKLANREKALEAYKRCYRNRRHDYIVRARARRSEILRATPAWANKDAIAAIYKEAGLSGLHVDHIVPLKGKTVSGLHVEANLQLLTPAENMKKGNRYAS